MDIQKLYFSIGSQANIPLTKIKEMILVIKYKALVINLINKYTEGSMYKQDGKAHYYVRNYNRLNHKLSIMLALLQVKQYGSEQELHKDVVKFYKQRTKYMSFYKQNTTAAQRKQARLKELQPELVKGELIHRGYGTDTSTDKRYKDHKFYIRYENFIYPISKPNRKDIKRLFAKVRLKPLTYIDKHGH